VLLLVLAFPQGVAGFAQGLYERWRGAARGGKVRDA
jgi:hypothetical protein